MNLDFTQMFQDIPAVIGTVESLVVAYEKKGNGEAKKQAVLTTLGVAYDVANSLVGVVLPPKEQVMQFADVAVNTVVSLKNNSGEFVHTVVSEVENGVKNVVQAVENEVSHVVQEVKQDVQNLVHPQA